jgi:hypothetical protein
MNVENPLAYHFILQDDIYLLAADKQAIKKKEPAAPEVLIVEKTPEPVFKYLGRHKKQYLIITYYPGLDFMEAGHLTALESTLKRLGYELDDTAIFNLAHYPEAKFKQITGFFKPKKVLILGNQAMPASTDAIHPNKAQQVDEVHALVTFSFDEMMDNVENKKAFWEAMKLF